MITKMEEGEPYRQKKSSNIISNVRNVFQSIGIRCFIKVDDKRDRWLLEWNFHFLPIISFLLYILLILI